MHCHESVVVQIEVQRRSVAGHEGIGRAQVLPQRLARQLGFQIPQGQVHRAYGAEGAASMTSLEYAGDHPVVQRSDGPRVLPFNHREQAVNTGVGTETHASEAVVRVQQQDVHRRHAVGGTAVDIADGATPALNGLQRGVADDL